MNITERLPRFEIPTALLPGVLMWSVFSEEKQLDFNGYALQLPDASLLVVDPPVAGDPIFVALEAYGRPCQVVVTNRDHERAADAFRQHYGISVAAHALDAPLLDVPPEVLFEDGDMLPGDLQVIHLPQQKSPGESALYWRDRGWLVVGDALIGKGPRTVGMLPQDKYADPARAFEALKRLADVHPGLEVLLTGDGPPILGQAQDVIESFLLQGM